MVAKNDMAHESLVNQLGQQNGHEKIYGVVHGVISTHDHGTIDAPIGRDKKDRQSMTVTSENGKMLSLIFMY
jgi:23S rRNA pseudouridine1911/1915/1917 synthase